MKKNQLNHKPDSIILQTKALIIKRPSLFTTVLVLLFCYNLTGFQKVQAQGTYGPPIFTEDFGTVPAGQDVNKYRGDISGRGTIGNVFTFWDNNPNSISSNGNLQWNSNNSQLSVLGNISTSTLTVTGGITANQTSAYVLGGGSQLVPNFINTILTTVYTGTVTIRGSGISF